MRFAVETSQYLMNEEYLGGRSDDTSTEKTKHAYSQMWQKKAWSLHLQKLEDIAGFADEQEIFAVEEAQSLYQKQRRNGQLRTRTAKEKILNLI